MALTWNWKDKIGTMTERRNEEETTYNIYKSNGLFVALYEWEENEEKLYQMCSFALDKTHLQNMLGLKNGYTENIFSSTIKLTLDMEHNTSKIIAEQFIKAKFDDNLIIELIQEAPF